jgi:hypothetical protein
MKLYPSLKSVQEGFWMALLNYKKWVGLHREGVSCWGYIKLCGCADIMQERECAGILPALTKTSRQSAQATSTTFF